jgi:hypothetical protein
LAALGAQQLGEHRHQFTGHAEHGTLGDHVMSSIWSILW